jgi:hypothetical protein
MFQRSIQAFSELFMKSCLTAAAVCALVAATSAPALANQKWTGISVGVGIGAGAGLAI